MKNTYLLQALTDHIARPEVVVRVLPDHLIVVMEEALTVRSDPRHQVTVQVVFQAQLEVQAEVLAYLAEAVEVVHQHRHQALLQENNLKKSYYESKNTFGYTIPMQFCDISTIIKLC